MTPPALEAVFFMLLVYSQKRPPTFVSRASCQHLSPRRSCTRVTRRKPKPSWRAEPHLRFHTDHDLKISRQVLTLERTRGVSHDSLWGEHLFYIKRKCSGLIINTYLNTNTSPFQQGWTFPPLALQSPSTLSWPVSLYHC